MVKKAEKVIIDTNLWISFLIKNDFKKLDEKIRGGKIKLVFSVDLIDEFLTVADRPKFRKYFQKNDVEQLIKLFDSFGEVIEVKSKVLVCRDPKDNFLLSLSTNLFVTLSLSLMHTHPPSHTFLTPPHIFHH